VPISVIWKNMSFKLPDSDFLDGISQLTAGNPHAASARE